MTDDEKFLAECEERIKEYCVTGYEAEDIARLIAMVRERDTQIKMARDSAQHWLDENTRSNARISQLESALRESLKTINEFGGIVSAHEDAIRSDSGNTNIQVWMEKLRAAREKIKGVLDGH